MWDDLLMMAGDVLLALIPDPSKADDFFIADVLETRQESRFPGRKCYAAFLRPLTHQPAAWYDCRKKHLQLLAPGQRVFVAIRKNKIVRVSELRQSDKRVANKSEKEIES